MTNYRRRRAQTYIDNVKSYTVNQKIQADKIMLISETGESLGVMTMQEARQLADEQEKDLVEVNPKAEPPVVKLIEYSKFKFQLEKSNKAKKVDDLKVLRVSVRISDHDLQTQARKAEGFLDKKLKIRLQVKMIGREKSHPEVAEETIKKFLSFIKKSFEFENPIKLNGDSYIATIKSGL